jgi:hypothetical protein
MRRRLAAIVTALALGVTATALSGCGSASATAGSGGVAAPTTTLPSARLIVRAARASARAPGYRVAARLSIEAGQTTGQGTMTGTVQRRGNRGAFSLRETVAGRTIGVQMRTVGQILYLSGIPDLSTLTHGRTWIRFALGAATRTSGRADLQTEAASDPARYLAYLAAAAGPIERLRTARIRGVPTTRYHATIDLGRVAARLPSAGRAQARRSIVTLESAIGADTLPVDVWIDAHHLVRQLQLRVALCADQQSLPLSMTIDPFDYGPVPAVTLPAASDTYDLPPQPSPTSAHAC